MIQSENNFKFYSKILILITSFVFAYFIGSGLWMEMIFMHFMKNLAWGGILID